jgi:TRAP-type C4-dicarboxylate transport system substrate-binding protein
MKTLHGITVGLAAGLLMSSGAWAAELPETYVVGVGLNGSTVVSFKDEVPFWSKTIPEASGGKVTAAFSPQDHMGVKGFQVLRMVKLGVVDFGAGDVSKMAQDSPVFEGCDLAGLALDIKTARAVCQAWLPTMSEVAEKLFNTKLLAVGTNPPQVVWCRVPISGLGDLKGKKIRVFNKTMSDFMEAVGGTTISMAFAEVVPALQRGVVDCAVTGTMSGFTAGWPEVSTHQFQVYMGWSINYQSVNLDLEQLQPRTAGLLPGAVRHLRGQDVADRRGGPRQCRFLQLRHRGLPRGRRRKADQGRGQRRRRGDP